VYEAFREMDADGSSTVEAAELKRALFSAAPMRSDEALLERRFAELDFDASGAATLPEFLYGVVSWVGLLEEDDMDNDDPTAEAAAQR
jgi:Ca2+-binding EF-hand superfamily protein